jgi:hypothetical protein
LNNVKSLFLEPGAASEQNQADPITIGKQRSFHLPMENNHLLVEQRIFYNQIGSATSEI